MSEIDWTFGGTWPYEPRCFDTPDGRMHYVDEGPRDGKPVVMFHGNPTWGYLYRRFIRDVVAAGHRAIALDHLGFGRSDKPDVADLAGEIEEGLTAFSDRDVKICWAMKDIAFTEEMLERA